MRNRLMMTWPRFVWTPARRRFWCSIMSPVACGSNFRMRATMRPRRAFLKRQPTFHQRRRFTLNRREPNDRHGRHPREIWL